MRPTARSSGSSATSRKSSQAPMDATAWISGPRAGVGWGVGVAVTVGAGVGDGIAVGVAAGGGVGVGVHAVVGVGDGLGVGAGVAVGTGVGEGVGAAVGVGDGAAAAVAAVATEGVGGAVSAGAAPQPARSTIAAATAAVLMRGPPSPTVRVSCPQASSASDWCSRSTIVSEWSAGYGGDVTNSTRAAVSPTQANSIVSRGRKRHTPRPPTRRFAVGPRPRRTK